MLLGMEAIEMAGMPKSHARCFQDVANRSRCVVSSRAVGRYATRLLLEGYASKGFHNKAKSCDWGPMAGFVLSDPQFTKRGMKQDAMGAQASDLLKAMHAGASEIPVWISEPRRLELEGTLGLGPPAAGSTDNVKRYVARGKEFVLKRDHEAPGNDGMTMWAVGYAWGELKVTATNLAGATTVGFAPVTAMVDPMCPPYVRRTYRAATTGDYDLFAVFPPVEGKETLSRAKDTRSVAGSDRFVLPMPAYRRREDPDMGNVTRRVRVIRRMLNEAVTAAGYRGGDCVHHSDEAGRPGVTEVDFPVIAFVPSEAYRHYPPYGLRNTEDLRLFIRDVLRFQYYVTFNPCWHRQLGIDVTPAGNYEVVEGQRTRVPAVEDRERRRRKSDPPPH